MSNIQNQTEKKLNLASLFLASKSKPSNDTFLEEIRHRMSVCGGIIRNKEKVEIAVNEACAELKILKKKLSAKDVRELAGTFLLIDLFLTHYIYLEAIKIYIEEGGRSRGSYLVTDSRGYHPEGIPESDWNFTICRYDREIENKILEIRYKQETVEKVLVKVRPVPDQELWFEKVWKKNLEDNLSDS
jgi:succinate dehydrogenase/fumarate reductase flavoprotein subunit